MFVETANYVEPTLIGFDVLPNGIFRASTVGLLRPEDVLQYAGFLRSIISGADFLTPEERVEQIEKRTDQYFVDALNDPTQWTLIAAKEAGQVVGVLGSKNTC